MDSWALVSSALFCVYRPHPRPVGHPLSMNGDGDIDARRGGRMWDWRGGIDARHGGRMWREMGLNGVGGLGM